MHTIQRKVVIYTTLRIVGYLLLWKYSCFIFGTENSNIFSLPTIHMNIQWDMEGWKWSPNPPARPLNSRISKESRPKSRLFSHSPKKRLTWKGWSETPEVIALVIENPWILNVYCLPSKDRRRGTSGHDFWKLHVIRCGRTIVPTNMAHYILKLCAWESKGYSTARSETVWSDTALPISPSRK